MARWIVPLLRKLGAGLFGSHVGGVPVGPVFVVLAAGARFVLAVRFGRAAEG
jgi:hypothetical protein